MRYIIVTSQLQGFLVLFQEQELTLETFLDNGEDGLRDMSAVNMMAGLVLKYESYLEAEALSYEALAMLSSRQMLGPESPQALYCLRRLIASV